MKNKTRRPEIDSDSPVIQNTLEYEVDEKERFEMFSDFVRYANSLGVEVNVKELYADYSEGKESAPMIAFAAWRAMNNSVVGRNDIFKRKRQNAGEPCTQK